MSSHQLEARAAKAKVDSLNKHVDILDEHINNLKRTIRLTNELVDSLRGTKDELEKFVQFAEEYYPGCVKQYSAIKALEGAKT